MRNIYPTSTEVNGKARPSGAFFMPAGCCDQSGQRDRPVSFRWVPTDEGWSQALGLPPPPTALHGKVRDAILLDAGIEAAAKGRWLSYSRGRGFYCRRYVGTACNRDRITWAVDSLADLGLLEHQKQTPGPAGRPQSRFRATPDLLEAITAPPLVTLSSACDPIRLKDCDKRLIDYSDTCRTRAMRRNLAALNEAMSSVTLAIGDTALPEDMAVVWCDGCPVYSAMRPVHRVFSHGLWSLGGRFYGGCWQNCPRDLRERIRIDGELTAEPDYPQLHPRLLYNLCGARLDGDAYTLEGFNRSEGKLAFNILLNATGHKANRGDGRRRQEGGIPDPRDDSQTSEGGRSLSLGDRAQAPGH